MIKFFRHIRQRLVAESKFSKYLLYAMGEIILVVIGILIALQINNWNEVRKERAREVNYLQNVKADLVSELENNNQFATYRFEKAKTCALLLRSVAPTTIKGVQEYTDKYEHVFIWNTFTPNNNTFRELLSSGNLSLLTNNSIKNALQELEKRYVAIAMGEEHMRREYEAYLYDTNVENVAALSFFDLSKPTYGFPKRLNADDIPDENQQKLIEDAQWQHSNQTFQNGLRLALMNNGYLAGIHKELITYLENIIALIEEETAE